MALKYFFYSIFLLLLSGNIYAEGNKELKEGDVIPDFKCKDLNGKEFSLRDLKGKYVYIDVWASWCPPCRSEIPHVKVLEEKLAKKKIVFVSISVERVKREWEEAVKELDMGGIQLYVGRDDAFIEAFNVKTIPRFILVDKKGRVVNLKMPRPSNSKTLDMLMTLKGI